MPNDPLMRYGGAASILAGISGAALTIISQLETPLPAWLSIVSLLTSLAALTAIYRYLKETAGKLGQSGFILSVLGSLLINLNVFIELTGIVYALGLIMIAAASLRSAQFPSWAPWMWIASPLIGFAGVFLAEIDILLFTLGSIAFGLGFFGYGAALWKSSERVAERPANI